MDQLGDDLLRLVRGRRDIVLAAPFVKAHVLMRLLQAMEADAKLTLVTRWRLEEIAAGVSDLAVFPLIKARQGAVLKLLTSLHAKYFRADDACLVGSANLTGAALGWTRPVNLELLIEVPAANPKLSAFEQEVMQSSFDADENLYSLMVKASEDLPPPPKNTIQFEVTTSEDSKDSFPADFEGWRPTLRQPVELYRAYRGDADLTGASQAAAELDLAILDLPTGLTETTFNSVLAVRLLQHPEVRAIDRFVVKPRRFGEVQAMLAGRGAEDPAHAWQTWMRWLLRFLPSRYASETPRHSEIFRRS